MAVAQWQKDSKKKLSGSFPWRWASRDRSSMADVSAEHFSLLIVLRARRYVCRKLGAGTIAGPEQTKKKLSMCTDKRKLKCRS